MSYNILVVCTGNICRSPAAAQLLEQRLGAHATITSAGLGAVAGAPLDPKMAAALQSLGLTPAEHAGRQLTDQMVAQADLVLTMDEAHRGQVVEQTPPALRRTYTLREYARLAATLHREGKLTHDADTPLEDRLRALTALEWSHRGKPNAGVVDNIDDPHGRPDATYTRAAGEIQQAIDTIVGALTK